MRSRENYMSEETKTTILEFSLKEGDHVLWIPKDIEECKKKNIKVETLSGIIDAWNAIFFVVKWDDTCILLPEEKSSMFNTSDSIYFRKIEAMEKREETDA
jgi:hypothetical protein